VLTISQDQQRHIPVPLAQQALHLTTGLVSTPLMASTMSPGIKPVRAAGRLLHFGGYVPTLESPPDFLEES